MALSVQSTTLQKFGKQSDLSRIIQDKIDRIKKQPRKLHFLCCAHLATSGTILKNCHTFANCQFLNFAAYSSGNTERQFMIIHRTVIFLDYIWHYSDSTSYLSELN